MKITVDQLLKAGSELIEAAFELHYEQLGRNGHLNSGINCTAASCVQRLKIADMLHDAAFATEEEPCQQQ